MFGAECPKQWPHCVVGGQGLRVAVTVGRIVPLCLLRAEEASQIRTPTITFKIIPNSASGKGATAWFSPC